MVKSHTQAACHIRQPGPGPSLARGLVRATSRGAEGVRRGVGPCAVQWMLAAGFAQVQRAYRSGNLVALHGWRDARRIGAEDEGSRSRSLRFVARTAPAQVVRCAPPRCRAAERRRVSSRRRCLPSEAGTRARTSRGGRHAGEAAAVTAMGGGRHGPCGSNLPRRGPGRRSQTCRPGPKRRRTRPLPSPDLQQPPPRRRSTGCRQALKPLAGVE